MRGKHESQHWFFRTWFMPVVEQRGLTDEELGQLVRALDQQFKYGDWPEMSPRVHDAFMRMTASIRSNRDHYLDRDGVVYDD